MAGITIQGIFALMSEENLNPSSNIRFRLGKTMVDPKSVTISGKRGWHGDPGEVTIEISSEFIDDQVRHRMKEMLAAHVDAAFAPKAVRDGE